MAWLACRQDAVIVRQLAHAYLPRESAATVETLLRRGKHQGAAQAFCDAFSRCWFPLADIGRGYHEEERLLGAVAEGISHEGYGENWMEYADVWSLKSVYHLAWSLLEDPYDWPDEDQEKWSLRDEIRDAVAHATGLRVEELFAGVPENGFPAAVLRPRLVGTRWEPLLWAAGWLWRASGNVFLDHSDDEDEPPAAWTLHNVLRLRAEYWEAKRVMAAIDELDRAIEMAPAACVRAAIAAALGPASGRVSTLLDLPMCKAAPGLPIQPSPLEDSTAASRNVDGVADTLNCNLCVGG